MRAASYFIIGLLFSGSLHLSAQILYTVTDLGAFFAYGLNDTGQVVGEVCTTACRSDRAVLWQSGTGLQDLGTLGGDINSARGINNAGQVVGYSTPGLSPIIFHAFLWQTDTGMQDLDALSGRLSRAFGINDSGQVVGVSYTLTEPGHAFVWQSGSGMQDLGTLGGLNSSALGINNNGQVVGDSDTVSGSLQPHAFLWQSGTGMQDLGTLGGLNSSALGINNAGQVVGDSETVSGSPKTHAFLWQSGTGMQDLGTLGGTFSVAFGINNRGQVVGYSLTLDGALHAFIYSNGQMTDLNNLIDPALQITLSDARAINVNGQIVANGSTSSGANHAFLLTPESCGAPVISDVSAAPNVLWPPNHRFVPVSIGYTVDDRCPSKCGLSISSNEPLNGKGDGNTSIDWQVIDAHQVQLRAERAGNGSGRVYTVSVTCTNDTNEQSSTKAIQVLVPHDQDH